MKFKFAHNNINVIDLEKSLKFYDEALGLKEVKRKEAEVRVLRSSDTWFGVTYKEDRDSVKQEFIKLVDSGVYTSPLFAD